MAEPRPLSQASIRLANAWTVLQRVRAAGVISRTQIAQESGLATMTVHRLLSDLRKKKLVLPAGRAESGVVGRPSSLFRFNGPIAHVIGIDVGNETTRAVISDLSGGAIARVERPTSLVEDDLLGSLQGIVRELRRTAGRSRRPLAGVAIGVAAVTEAEGTIVRASMHRLWDGLQLGALLRGSLGCDVATAQDDSLAALAELNHGACIGLRNALVIDVGKGVGAGIILNGSVYPGAHASAGRLAWIQASREVPTGSGAVPLGELLTADGLQADYRRLGGRAHVQGAIDVFGADSQGDQAAAGAIALFAERLAWTIAVAFAVLDPQRVVMGGGISGSFERLEPQVSARLAEMLVRPPPVLGSTLGPEAVVMGAVDAALDLADSWLRERIAGEAL